MCLANTVTRWFFVVVWLIFKQWYVNVYFCLFVCFLILRYITEKFNTKKEHSESLNRTYWHVKSILVPLRNFEKINTFFLITELSRDTGLFCPFSYKNGLISRNFPWQRIILASLYNYLIQQFSVISICFWIKQNTRDH